MLEVNNVAPKWAARTSRAVLPHEKPVTVTTAAQHTSSPFSESVWKIGVGLPWVYWVGYRMAGCNVVVISIVSALSIKIN